MTIEEFYKLLETHDWSYQYSDDHSVWRRGRQRGEQLLRLAETNDTFKQLWEDFRAWALASPRDRPEKPLLGDYTNE